MNGTVWQDGVWADCWADCWQTLTVTVRRKATGVRPGGATQALARSNAQPALSRSNAQDASLRRRN